jgi:hypothetical protein
MATYASTYGNPDWYKSQMSGDVAKQQADQLGITTDQLFKLYAQTNQIGGVGMAPQKGQQGPSQGQIAQWAAGPGVDVSGQRQNLITAIPGSNQITQMYGPMAAWNQVNPPPQPQQQPQFQMPQLQPQQPMPTVQTQTLTPTGPYGAVNTQQPSLNYNAPAVSAQQTTPLFTPQQSQLGVQPLQPGQIRQYQSGGLVQSNQQPDQQNINIQASDPTAMTGMYNPSNLASALGAVVLGSPMIVNPQPSGTPSSKSGVASVGGAQYYSTPGALAAGQASYQLPSGAILSGDQMRSLTSADVQELQKGVQMGTVKMVQPQTAMGGPQGPWNAVPGLFNKAPMPMLPESTQNPLTPRTPANAAQMPAPGPVPTYAQQIAAPMPAGVTLGAPFGAPPAPGAAPMPQQPPQISQAAIQSPGSLFQAHTSALAEAGKAMYAHFGGDPGSATPKDIANFHTELQGALAGGPPVKRRSGGIIPGSGNQDTVPAMLTPGEFVMNKGAVQNIGVGNLEAMNAQHFDQGGEVLPKEAEHKSISGDSSSAPAAPSSSQEGTSTMGQGITQAAQAYSRTMSSWSPNTSQGTGQGPAWGGYADRMGLSALATNAYQAPAGSNAPTVGSWMQTGQGAPGAQSLGQYTGPGSGYPTKNALGAIGSGLQDVAKSIGSMEGSWQMQPSHIPDPRYFQRYQTPTFSQETQT